MLIVNNQQYFDKVVDFAKATGGQDNLQEALDYLDSYAEDGDRGKTQCVLWEDFAPASFNFLMKKRQPDGTYSVWFRGGLIFHGKSDQWDTPGPTLSVTLSNTGGWEVHT